jgi:hypothetical protein
LSKIAVVEFSGSREDAKALAIALNRSAELANWNLEQLESTLIEVAEFGHTPEDLGFDTESIDKLFPPAPIEEPEAYRTAAPDIEKETQAPVYSAQYALIFDNEDQEKRFYTWIKSLDVEYPEADTVAARIDAHIREVNHGKGEVT